MSFQEFQRYFENLTSSLGDVAVGINNASASLNGLRYDFDNFVKVGGSVNATLVGMSRSLGLYGKTVDQISAQSKALADRFTLPYSQLMAIQEQLAMKLPIAITKQEELADVIQFAGDRFGMTQQAISGYLSRLETLSQKSTVLYQDQMFLIQASSKLSEAQRSGSSNVEALTEAYMAQGEAARANAEIAYMSGDISRDELASIMRSIDGLDKQAKARIRNAEISQQAMTELQTSQIQFFEILASSDKVNDIYEGMAIGPQALARDLQNMVNNVAGNIFDGEKFNAETAEAQGVFATFSKQVESGMKGLASEGKTYQESIAALKEEFNNVDDSGRLAAMLDHMTSQEESSARLKSIFTQQAEKQAQQIMMQQRMLALAKEQGTEAGKKRLEEALDVAIQEQKQKAMDSILTVTKLLNEQAANYKSLSASTITLFSEQERILANLAASGYDISGAEESRIQKGQEVLAIAEKEGQALRAIAASRRALADLQAKASSATGQDRAAAFNQLLLSNKEEISSLEASLTQVTDDKLKSKISSELQSAKEKYDQARALIETGQYDAAASLFAKKQAEARSAEADAIQLQVKSYQDALDVVTKFGSQQQRIAENNVSLAKSELDLIDSVASGIGASAEARLKAAEEQGKVVKGVEDQIAAVEKLQETQRVTLEQAEQAAAAAEAAGKSDEAASQRQRAAVAASNLKDAEQRIVKLTAERNSALTQQLQLTKQIREGYLDALTNMQEGAGVFTEIIINQEQNLGTLLRTSKDMPTSLRTGSNTGQGAGISTFSGAGFEAGDWGPDVAEYTNELISNKVPEIIEHLKTIANRPQGTMASANENRIGAEVEAAGEGTTMATGKPAPVVSTTPPPTSSAGAAEAAAQAAANAATAATAAASTVPATGQQLAVAAQGIQTSAAAGAQAAVAALANTQSAQAPTTPPAASTAAAAETAAAVATSVAQANANSPTTTPVSTPPAQQDLLAAVQSAASSGQAQAEAAKALAQSTQTGAQASSIPAAPAPTTGEQQIASALQSMQTNIATQIGAAESERNKIIAQISANQSGIASSMQAYVSALNSSLAQIVSSTTSQENILKTLQEQNASLTAALDRLNNKDIALAQATQPVAPAAAGEKVAEGLTTVVQAPEQPKQVPSEAPLTIEALASAISASNRDPLFNITNGIAEVVTENKNVGLSLNALASQLLDQAALSMPVTNVNVDQSEIVSALKENANLQSIFDNLNLETLDRLESLLATIASKPSDDLDRIVSAIASIKLQPSENQTAANKPASVAEEAALIAKAQKTSADQISTRLASLGNQFDVGTQKFAQSFPVANLDRGPKQPIPSFDEFKSSFDSALNNYKNAPNLEKFSSEGVVYKNNSDALIADGQRKIDSSFASMNGEANKSNALLKNMLDLVQRASIDQQVSAVANASSISQLSGSLANLPTQIGSNIPAPNVNIQDDSSSILADQSSGVARNVALTQELVDFYKSSSDNQIALLSKIQAASEKTPDQIGQLGKNPSETFDYTAVFADQLDATKNTAQEFASSILPALNELKYIASASLENQKTNLEPNINIVSEVNLPESLASREPSRVDSASNNIDNVSTQLSASIESGNFIIQDEFARIRAKFDEVSARLNAISPQIASELSSLQSSPISQPVETRSPVVDIVQSAIDQAKSMQDASSKQLASADIENKGSTVQEKKDSYQKDIFSAISSDISKMADASLSESPTIVSPTLPAELSAILAQGQSNIIDGLGALNNSVQSSNDLFKEYASNINISKSIDILNNNNRDGLNMIAQSLSSIKNADNNMSPVNTNESVAPELISLELPSSVQLSDASLSAMQQLIATSSSQSASLMSDGLQAIGSQLSSLSTEKQPPQADAVENTFDFSSMYADVKSILLNVEQNTKPLNDMIGVLNSASQPTSKPVANPEISVNLDSEYATNKSDTMSDAYQMLADSNDKLSEQIAAIGEKKVELGSIEFRPIVSFESLSSDISNYLQQNAASVSQSANEQSSIIDTGIASLLESVGAIGASLNNLKSSVDLSYQMPRQVTGEVQQAAGPEQGQSSSITDSIYAISDSVGSYFNELYSVLASSEDNVPEISTTVQVNSDQNAASDVSLNEKLSAFFGLQDKSFVDINSQLTSIYNNVSVGLGQIGDTLTKGMISQLEIARNTVDINKEPELPLIAPTPNKSDAIDSDIKSTLSILPIEDFVKSISSKVDILASNVLTSTSLKESFNFPENLQIDPGLISALSQLPENIKASLVNILPVQEQAAEEKIEITNQNVIPDINIQLDRSPDQTADKKQTNFFDDNILTALSASSQSSQMMNIEFINSALSELDTIKNFISNMAENIVTYRAADTGQNKVETKLEYPTSELVARIDSNAMAPIAAQSQTIQEGLKSFSDGVQAMFAEALAAIQDLQIVPNIQVMETNVETGESDKIVAALGEVNNKSTPVEKQAEVDKVDITSMFSEVSNGLSKMASTLSDAASKLSLPLDNKIDGSMVQSAISTGISELQIDSVLQVPENLLNAFDNLAQNMTDTLSGLNKISSDVLASTSQIVKPEADSSIDRANENSSSVAIENFASSSNSLSSQANLLLSNLAESFLAQKSEYAEIANRLYSHLVGFEGSVLTALGNSASVISMKSDAQISRLSSIETASDKSSASIIQAGEKITSSNNDVSNYVESSSGSDVKTIEFATNPELIAQIDNISMASDIIALAMDAQSALSSEQSYHLQAIAQNTSSANVVIENLAQAMSLFKPEIDISIYEQNLVDISSKLESLSSIYKLLSDSRAIDASASRQESVSTPQSLPASPIQIREARSEAIASSTPPAYSTISSETMNLKLGDDFVRSISTQVADMTRQKVVPAIVDGVAQAIRQGFSA